jgi:dynactin 1
MVVGDADDSLTAQFAHLGSTVFDRPELDVPEQQLALAYTIDYDLDNFAAAVGFARQSVYSLTQEAGKLTTTRWIELIIEIEIEVGGSSLEAGVYEPVQRILDQVRTVKVSSRYVISSGVVLMNSKLVAQMEEVWQISSALLPEVTVALADLSTSVSSAVDLAVQVRRQSQSVRAQLTISWHNESVLMQLLSAHQKVHFDYPISRDS